MAKDITDVASLEIERPRLAGSPEHAHASLPFDVILPFVGVGVPMHLALPTRINLNQRRGGRGVDREIPGITDPHRSAARVDRFLRHQPVAERLRYRSCSRYLVRAERARHRSRKYIELAGIGRMAEQP